AEKRSRQKRQGRTDGLEGRQRGSGMKSAPDERPPPEKRNARGEPGESGQRTTGSPDRTASGDHPQRFWVLIRGTRPRHWGHYPTLIEAERQVAQLRKHRFDAVIDEAAEHRGERRR